AGALGFPVLVKAAAGGGGKGMRIVEDLAALPAALAAAGREAESAFGDGTLLVERYLPSPRHVEIQILGDAHGTLLHCFERECSIQRRARARSSGGGCRARVLDPAPLAEDRR